MIIDKKFTLSGNQAYTLSAGDVIAIKVKGLEEFKYKIPDNWQGSVTININGVLSEITPTTSTDIKE